MVNKLNCLYLFAIIMVFLCNCSKNDGKNNYIAQNLDVSNNISENDIDEELTNENLITHYTTANLRLRSSDNLDSQIIITLPQYTFFRIIETGRTETIDGITAPWIKIENLSGNVGWCFSGYMKEIGNTIIDELAIIFANRKSGSYLGVHERILTEKITSIDLIAASAGYYIQQEERRFQDPGRASEILTLSVENENVFIREIDILNGKEIIRNEILLENDGNTYTHNCTRLETRDGKIQIVYQENVPEKSWLGSWNYNIPFTFAGYLNSAMPDTVIWLTTDFLIGFTGEYIFESYRILCQENIDINLDLIKDTLLKIDYSQKEKSLTIPYHDLTGFFERDDRKDWVLNFVETQEKKPFWWTYGEGGAGFVEVRYFFLQGGIAFTYESSRNIRDENGNIIGNSYLKYIVFFEENKKKENGT